MGTGKDSRVQASAADSSRSPVPRINNKLWSRPSSPAPSLQSCFVPPSEGGGGHLPEKSGAPRSAPGLQAPSQGPGPAPQ